MPPPRVKTVYHCFTARGAGACIAADMPTTERHVLLPIRQVSVVFLLWYIVVGGAHRDLPNKNMLAVIPIVWAITMPVGVFCVSKLSIVKT